MKKTTLGSSIFENGLNNSEKREFQEFAKIWIPKKDYREVSFEDFLWYCRFNSEKPDPRMSYYEKTIEHIKKIILEIENKTLREYTKVIDLLIKNIQ